MFSFSTFGVRGLGHFAPKFAFSYGLKNSIGQPAVHFFTQIITYPEFPNTKNYVISASPEFRNTENYVISAPVYCLNYKTEAQKDSKALFLTK